MKITYSLISVLHNDFGEKTVCIGLNYRQFLSDLNFTADTGFDKCDEYPAEVFHETLSNFMEQFGEDKLELPLLFSLELDEEMSMLGLPFRYTFLMTDREHFKQLCRLYEVDKETEEKCLCDDTDCIVIYTGMSLQE
ncbi:MULTISPECIES: hypothetical protein [unclassified Clostridioides]|uniref:hypothetical protein n=1 Tax=unclassified Clostridioides TaxID=2635829 RepID=UPI001D0C8EBB|nr:hypothetical protein [Clostridioides sp. ES-S-0145-01]MCC0762027.1 hypothetical protein [Clostridioides sp. ES-S-0006-03]UDN63426.1 hypothetical protein IC758_08195 [Clostridioides sp. ES-W-0016-02]